ncbi:ABC transporter family substrate-binding protein [Streptomyces sp. A3M-1-3]|uniref:ABC transporter family substrate-binding protein n=1 Tax=Streptomyces sp. A3M-1-3 TaxID=2962044 RepID=UPI0020B74F4C|nr:ABC transporter family substrate-binding protein [Streptomyces sp. A3M-1-3]MCP3820751.1 ABC transporter family substrate-binding protein [Streptomyces sp. A3M-1-3]
MSHVGVPRGTAPRRRRSVTLLTTGVLALPLLAGCSAGDDETGTVAAVQDIGAANRELVADGGALRWAVDAMPETLNAFQADADATTGRIAGAVLPALYTLDERGRAVRNPDYLESAKVVEREPKQVVVYKLNQEAVWSNGREIGAPDFVAQWRALRGKDSAYWTARNAGYERIEKIERGANDLEVKVTFAKPYADWQSLFTPLYPKDVTGTPDAFNEGARTQLKATAGPFVLQSVDKKAGKATLGRNPRWWGQPPKLDALVFTAVPLAERTAALAAGKLDLAEIDKGGADRIWLSARQKTGGAGPSPLTNGKGAAADTPDSALMAALRGFVVRKSLEPAYTQLALNGASGPLADERVRRAVARALDRQELAEVVLKPLGLPVQPLGSHLALAGQRAYADNSGALGGQDTEAAQALLADAGWRRGGPVREETENTKAGSAADEKKAAEKKPDAKPDAKAGSESRPGSGSGSADDGTYIVGQEDDDSKPVGAARGTDSTHVLAPAPPEAAVRDAPDRPRTEARNYPIAGAYAPKGTAAPPAPAGPAAGGLMAKDGKALSLRFVLPSGSGSEALRAVGTRISRMLDSIGIRTEIVKVADESFFKDHIASGEYDLALYSWPATAFPATDARPIFAKPEPAADGSLLVEQNYTRVGTDHIDQLFDQALAELDEDEARDLVRRADARIWAAAGSIPLYQRPELVAAKPSVANAGAFGLGSPRYQDIGFKRAEKARKGR